MTQFAGAVIGMATAALLVAYLAFGWPVLVIGGPLLVGVAITLLALALTEKPREALRERRAALVGDTGWKQAAERGEPAVGGPMSGFFEVSPQVPALPEQRPALSHPARRTGASRP